MIGHISGLLSLLKSWSGADSAWGKNPAVKGCDNYHSLLNARKDILGRGNHEGNCREPENLGLRGIRVILPGWSTDRGQRGTWCAWPSCGRRVSGQ